MNDKLVWETLRAPAPARARGHVGPLERKSVILVIVAISLRFAVIQSVIGHLATRHWWGDQVQAPRVRLTA